MGDHAYTRFSIPALRLTEDHRDHLCSILKMPRSVLDQLLAKRPLPLDAGYDNSAALRLVEGCPCMVIEHDDWNHAGSTLEDELHNSGIAYVRINEPGRDYGASQTIYDGTNAVEIRLDCNGCVIVGVTIGGDGTVAVDADELEEVERFLRTKNRTLHPPTSASLTPVAPPGA